MKRMIAMLLLVTMVLSMAGCGSENTMSDEELMEKVNAITPYMSGEIMSMLPLTDKTVTYSVMAEFQGYNVDPEYIPLQKWLELNTNVDFEYKLLKPSQVSTRVSTTMASGDLPDVFINCLHDNERLTYGPAGALLPIDEYLDMMPNYSKLLEEPGVRAAVTATDGHIYSIPQLNMYSIWPGDGVHVTTTVSINKKWLDALGLEIPTTTEEFEQVLTAFVTQDPNGNGEADEIGMTFRYSEADEANEGAWAFLFGPYGILGWGGHKNVENGKVFYAIEDERYVEAVEWIQRLYQNGLIDSEFDTMDTNRYNAKVSKGNVGVYIDWDGTTYTNDPQDPTYITLPPLTGPHGDCVYSNQAAGLNVNYCCIASTAKNPELLCRFFDLMLSEDISFQTLWGAFGDYSVKNEDGTYTRYYGEDYPLIFESAVRVMPAYFTNEMVQRTTEKNMDTGEIHTKTDNHKASQAAVYAPFAVKEYYPLLIADGGTEEGERLAILTTPVMNALNEQELKWITGTGDIRAEWPDFLEKIYDLGLQEMRDIYQQSLDMALAGE